MDEQTKNVSKDLVLEEVIINSIKIPGVKVNRNKFLADWLKDSNNIADILEKGPVEAGITRKEINRLAKKLIISRTSQSSAASFVAGIPGGLAMAATIPADILQFFGMSLRLAQELSYLYGAQDLWSGGEVDDEKVKNQLILYCGVMFGVSGAVSGVRVLSTQISKTALKKIPQKVLTKTFWYPVLKKIGKTVGVTITKKTLASGVSKAIPIIGGFISGGINFASMMPMANRLDKALDEAAFDYSDEEFNKDIEIISNIDVEVETIDEKVEIDSLNKSADNIQDNKENDKEKIIEKQVDPYQELIKLKELLDMGVITQEDFDQKKKQLLGL